MNIESVMEELRTKGKPNTAKIYHRHGVQEESYGVSYADLEVFVKRIGADHDLAQALWATGIHDARILATKIAVPERMSQRDIHRWLKACSNHVANGAVSGLAARMPKARDVAAACIEKTNEWNSAAGWEIYAILATGGAMGEAEGRRLIDRIEADIAQAPNRTRHCMNNALIAIGGTIDGLRDAALAAAKAIGKVNVDHGQTSCKTPDATQYIAKMVQHRSTRGTARATTATRKKNQGSQKEHEKRTRPESSIGPSLQPSRLAAKVSTAATRNLHFVQYVRMFSHHV